MIAQVTGPPGAGKSYYAVRKASEALEQGKVVVTNFQMREDWVERVVRHHPRRWMFPWRRKKMIANWKPNFMQVEDMSQLNRIRLQGEGEGRGVVVLDEGHRFLNSRQWNDEGRKEAVDFFTLHRKLGWDVYLITQDAANLDKQVRNLFEYHVRLKNLKRLRILGIPVVPFNLFLAVWDWHGIRTVTVGRKPVKREMYRLTWRAKLYDSYGIPGEEGKMPADAIIMPPLPPASAAAPPEAATTTASAASEGGAPDAGANRRRRWLRWPRRREALLGAIATGLLIVQQNGGVAGGGLF